MYEFVFFIWAAITNEQKWTHAGAYPGSLRGLQPILDHLLTLSPLAFGPVTLEGYGVFCEHNPDQFLQSFKQVTLPIWVR